MSMSAILPPKKDVALALLERASVFIHLDPRGEQVMVPNWLKTQPQLVLQVGLNMAVGIPDLDVNDEALSCTLSFNRRPQFCQVPWGSVYALVGEDGRGMIWPEDIPAEVAAQSEQPPALRSVDGSDAKRSRSKRRTSAAEGAGLAGSAPATPTGKPQLVALPGDKGAKSPGAGALAGVVPTAPSPSQPQASPAASRSSRPHLRLVK